MVKAALACLVIVGTVSQASAAPESEGTAESHLVGTYVCTGINPDKTTYEGIVEIVKNRDTYLVRWTMPDRSQVLGVGILTGRMLSVSYFGGTPSLVVYSVGENGRLDGQWTGGSAEGAIFKETLTKLPAGAVAPRTPAKPTNRESRPRSRIMV